MRRTLIAAACALFLAVTTAALLRHGGRLAELWDRWRHPATQSAPDPLGDAILKESAARRAAEISREYLRIRGLMDEARARGADVNALEPALTLALNAAREGRYRHAGLLLNSVEMRIPKARKAPPPAARKKGRRRAGGAR